jgi:transcriptional regulator with XRE-family HTH domain
MPTPANDADDPSRPKRRVSLGPTGERVRQNVQQFRKHRRLTHAGVVERLKLLGYSIPRTGLSEIENGGRRVTVDDLMALAVALDVTPNDLLLPLQISQEPVEVTALGTVDPKDLWRWADGVDALPLDPPAGLEEAPPGSLEDDGSDGHVLPPSPRQAARYAGEGEPPTMDEILRSVKAAIDRLDRIDRWVKERPESTQDEDRPADGHD